MNGHQAVSIFKDSKDKTRSITMLASFTYFYFISIVQSPHQEDYLTTMACKISTFREANIAEVFLEMRLLALYENCT
jgi:hypothetical protein